MNRASLLMAAALAATAMVATPAMARDSLGIWNDWGAFRDPGVPRCYAIAMARPIMGRKREFQPYLTVSTWPTRGVRGQIHVRLARRVDPGARVTLSIAGQTFSLLAGGASAWAADRRADAAIVAALRSASDLVVTARAPDGRSVRDSWRLAGIASALDAAALACAGR